MKKIINLISLSVILLTITILSVSCDKLKEETKIPKYKSAQDNATAEMIFGGVFSKVSDASDRSTRSKDGKMTDTGCPTLTVEPADYTTYPKTITIDFGTACIGSDAVTRSGKIVSIINNPYIDSLTTVTSTLENYHEIINFIDYTITGTQVVQNLGRNSSGHPIFSVNVTNATISSTYGVIHWQSQRQNEWVAGYNTWMNIFDDEYLVTGTSSGTDINGDNFSINIITALRYAILCGFISEGSLEIVNPGYPTIVVDYGNGTCDRSVTVTINGMNYPFYM